MRILRSAVLFACLAAVTMVGQEPSRTEAPESKWAALHGDGRAAFYAGRYAEALADFQASLPLSSNRRERAMALSDIGYALTELGRSGEALTKRQEALEGWRSIDPAGHDAQQVAIVVGILQRTVGSFQESEKTLRAVTGSITATIRVALLRSPRSAIC